MHADKDWIKLRADMNLDVTEDAVRAHDHGTSPSSSIAEAVELLTDSPKYMRVYADALDRRLHGEPIPEEPIQR